MNHILSLIVGFITLSDLCRSQTCPNSDIPHNCTKCTSHDDPHITTFDGVRYDQHTDGCFKYITSCPSAPYNLPFEVCGCHYNCGAGGGGADGKPCPSSVRCIGDLKLTFFESDGSPSYQVTVDKDNANDDAVDALSTSLSSGSTYIFDSSSSHYFVYTKSTSLSSSTFHTFEIFSGVAASATFYGHIRYSVGNLEMYLTDDYFNDVTCGLCGYLTGSQSDDFTGFDGNLYLDPNDLSIGNLPIAQTNVALINEFANTYLCNLSAALPYDPACAVTESDEDCVLDAAVCCQQLWDDLFSNEIWINPIVDQTEFMNIWLINCALDACALTFNNVDCTNMGDEYASAKLIAYETANTVYDTTAPQTPSPTEVVDASNCTAKICAHGDNTISLDVSYDSGSTWDFAVASQSFWQQTMIASINPIDADTVLRFTVEDTCDFGGFLATIQLCGANGYVFEFYTNEMNTYFDVISDTASDLLIDEFVAFGAGLWAAHVNEDMVTCMNTDADWIWNDQTLNTMVFEVDFGHHLDILQRLECVSEDTLAPSTDCCSMAVSDYLDTCYCLEDSTNDGVANYMNKGELIDAIANSNGRLNAASVSGASVGINAINEAPELMNQAVYKEMMENVKLIKRMLYGTWVILFCCLVINIACSPSTYCHCNNINGEQIPSVYKSDEEDI